MIKSEISMSKTVRQEVADEIMVSIASLMPERYRGPYVNNRFAEARHLQVLEPPIRHLQ